MLSHKRNYFFALLSLFIFTSTQAADIGYLKIDYQKKWETLGGSSYLVVDVRQYKEFPTTSLPGLKAVDAADIFQPNTVLFGFGLPNVYIGKVTDDDKFVKFAAKSFHRAESQIEETDGRTQSGIFLVPKNFPQASLERIIARALANVGSTKASCAQANATILHEAGCRISGGVDLDQYFYPSSLLQDILEKGFECDGHKIDFDIVASTHLSLHDFFAEIQTAEKLINTALRHLSNAFDTKEAVIERQQEARKIKAENETSLHPFVEVDAGNTFEVKTSKTTQIGSMLREIWGAHVIYEVNLKDRHTHVEQFLPQILKAFPHESPSFATIIKRDYIFNEAVVDNIHYNMACDYSVSAKVSEHDFITMLKPHSSKEPHLYNFVITDDKIIISHIEDGFVSWALSKHVLLSNYSKSVRFAGEFWKDDQGRIFINNNSGTYLPTEDQLAKAVNFLQTLITTIPVIGVKNVIQ